jgi:hypothetical protein
MSERQPTVRLRLRHIRSTRDAALFAAPGDGSEVWIARSVISDRKHIEGDYYQIKIPAWVAQEKGLA